MSTKKIICVWIGNYKSEEDFYQDYLRFNYENEENPISKFGIDAELEYYDQDFMESWWFEKLEINNLVEYQDELLDSKYFFDDLLIELKERNLKNINYISFLFGEIGSNPTNEILFEYSGLKSTEKPIEFVFKKEYKLI